MFIKTKKRHENIFYTLYTFENDFMKITFSQLGATIVDWQTKNRDGRFESIVLKYQNIDDYFNNEKRLGATIGPYAGRIYPPVIHFENVSYALDPNFRGHSCIHGGKDNIQYHLYNVETKDNTIVFKSNNKESLGFSGTSSFKITFEIIDNLLKQTYETTTKTDTYTNLTNHTYFNLSGDLKYDILNHVLKIPAHRYGDLNEYFITNEILTVENTLFDFRTPKSVKKTIFSLHKTPIKGLDHPYILDEGVISLYDPTSGRLLEMTTNQDAVVVYSNNFLTDQKLHPGQIDQPYLAICLETQHYPNDIHQFINPKSFHPKNTKHVQQTCYKITII